MTDDVLFFGTGLPEDRWHDEHASIDMLSADAASLANVWYRLPDL